MKNKYTAEQLLALIAARREADLALNLAGLWDCQPVDFGFVTVNVTADDISITKNRGAPWTTKDVSPDGLRVMTRIFSEALEVFDSLQDTADKEVSDDASTSKT